MIIIHGFKDYSISVGEFCEILNTVQVGASKDCDVSIGLERKSIEEWQRDSNATDKAVSAYEQA